MNWARVLENDGEMWCKFNKEITQWQPAMKRHRKLPLIERWAVDRCNHDSYNCTCLRGQLGSHMTEWHAPLSSIIIHSHWPGRTLLKWFCFYSNHGQSITLISRARKPSACLDNMPQAIFVKTKMGKESIMSWWVDMAHTENMVATQFWSVSKRRYLELGEALTLANVARLVQRFSTLALTAEPPLAKILTY